MSTLPLLTPEKRGQFLASRHVGDRIRVQLLPATNAPDPIVPSGPFPAEIVYHTLGVVGAKADRTTVQVFLPGVVGGAMVELWQMDGESLKLPDPRGEFGYRDGCIVSVCEDQSTATPPPAADDVIDTEGWPRAD